MRLVLDGRMLGWTGIGRYTRRLLEELPAAADDVELVLLVHPADHPQLPAALAARVTTVAVAARPHRPAEQTALPRVLGRLHADLVHFPHFSVPLAYRGRFVVTVHDLTLLRYPARPGHDPATEARRVVKQRVGRLTMRWAVQHAARVITPSRFTADDLQTTFGVPDERIVVVPNGVDAPPAPDADVRPVPGVPAGRPFVLYVGNCHPHKRVAVAVEAVARLADGGHPDVRLVVTGPGGPWTDRLLDDLRGGGRDHLVHHTGVVTDAELAWLYDRAAVLVQPSEAEGFGLTGLEAMAHGLPVVAARASCLPEVYGDAAAWFAPGDAADLASRLAAVLDDPTQCQRLVDAGRRRAARFTWHTTAAATLAVYRQAMATPSAHPERRGPGDRRRTAGTTRP